MTAPATWVAALKDSFGILKSQIKVLPLTLLSAIQSGTVPQSAPTDSAPPPTATGVVGDGATQDQIGSWTPPLGSVRCDGYRQISITLEVFGSSGACSATFQPYFFDGVRWCACADTITITTSSVTSSSPAARQRHDIVVENDFGFMLVITAISGSGATAAAYATFRDLVIGQK